MKLLRGVLLAAALAAAPALWAQQADLRTRLAARGLPAGLTDEVVAIAADAVAQGLPADPLADKAIEGFAKHVPPPRIVAALRQFSVRMLQARGAVREAGVSAPPGDLIAAAAEAMQRGLESAQVGTVVRAAPERALAAPALTVTAALAAQGMASDQAVLVVADAMRAGRTMAQILDLPAVARAMQAQGMTPAEAGRRMLRGAGPPPGEGGLSPGGRMRGRPGRPPGVTPPMMPPGGMPRPRVSQPAS